MENYIKTINSIEELNSKLEEQQEKIKDIDTESASLVAIEGDNKLDIQQQRLADLEKAVDALSTEAAKNAVDMEIDAIKASIKNINRLAELADQRVKTLQRLQKLSNDLTAVIGIYKGYRTDFEKKFNKISKDTAKLLSNEEIPQENEENQKEKKELFFTSPPEEEIEEEEKLTLEIPESESASEESDSDCKIEDSDSEEEPQKDSLRALASVLKNFETLTSQNGAKEYHCMGMLKEVAVSDSEKEAIESLMTTEVIDGLTPEMTKILQGSIPASLLKRIGRKDLILERGKENEIYTSDAFKKDRKAFTYTLISGLVRILQNQDEDPAEKQLKLETFFRQNSDSVEGKLVKRPVFRAFIILKAEDLTR